MVVGIETPAPWKTAGNAVGLAAGKEKFREMLERGATAEEAEGRPIFFAPPPQ